MSITSPASLSDAVLLTETARAAADERRTTSELLVLLAELDIRKLFLAQGYPSLFVWCTQVLHLSEPAAYSRITAARLSKRIPSILHLLASGDLTLASITVLAAHLTDENQEALLEASRHKSKRDVERLVAGLDAQPEIPSSIRKLPAPTGPALAPSPDTSQSLSMPRPAPVTSYRPAVAPISADRYLLKVTLSEDAYAKLEQARALLRHAIPTGDPAAIVDRALTVLIEQLEKTKLAATSRPRGPGRTTSASARRVPATVRRAVWTRDQGRCAFVGTDERCPETAFLEFHHVIPFARGGPTTVENIELRCRAHNAHEATLAGQSWRREPVQGAT